MKPVIIFDTDMDTDCDDAGALAMICEYVRRDRAELLGVIADTVSPNAAPCCEALLDFWQVRRPIGAVYADFCPDSERFARYRAHSERCGERRYNRIFADRIGRRDTDYPAAAQVYRQLLADAPDGSITVVCVGLLTAVFDAIASDADLFRRKVKCVVTMGQSETEKANFNWEMDGIAAEHFLANCPVPVYASGAGTPVITGAHLRERFGREHPLCVCYETFAGVGKGRSSWDLIAALYALEPDTPLLRLEPRGDCRYDSAARRSYHASGNRGDGEILVNASNEALAEYLDARMCGDF